MKFRKPRRAPDVELRASDSDSSEEIQIWFKERYLFSKFTPANTTPNKVDRYKYEIERWVSSENIIIWTVRRERDDNDNRYILSNSFFYLFGDFKSKIEKHYQEYLAKEALEKAIKGGK